MSNTLATQHLASSILAGFTPQQHSALTLFIRAPISSPNPSKVPTTDVLTAWNGSILKTKSKGKDADKLDTSNSSSSNDFSKPSTGPSLLCTTQEFAGFLDAMLKSPNPPPEISNALANAIVRYPRSGFLNPIEAFLAAALAYKAALSAPRSLQDVS